MDSIRHRVVLASILNNCDDESRSCSDQHSPALPLLIMPPLYEPGPTWSAVLPIGWVRFLGALSYIVSNCKSHRIYG